MPAEYDVARSVIVRSTDSRYTDFYRRFFGLDPCVLERIRPWSYCRHNDPNLRLTIGRATPTEYLRTRNVRHLFALRPHIRRHVNCCTTMMKSSILLTRRKREGANEFEVVQLLVKASSSLAEHSLLLLARLLAVHRKFDVNAGVLVTKLWTQASRKRLARQQNHGISEHPKSQDPTIATLVHQCCYGRKPRTVSNAARIDGLLLWRAAALSMH